VSAKDLGSGKQQQVRIESSGTLSKNEIDRMVKDAESHAADDRREKELAETRNEADTLIYAAEKAVKEGDADPAVKVKVESAVAEIKNLIKTDDISSIRQAKTRLENLVRELSKPQAANRNSGNGDFTGNAADASQDNSYERNAKDEKVYDAEYEVVDDERKAG